MLNGIKEAHTVTEYLLLYLLNTPHLTAQKLVNTVSLELLLVT